MLVWLALVLQVVSGAWALDRMLCVGSDGHVALELVHAGACSVEARRHHEPDHELASACSGHDCTDIVLSAPSTRPESVAHVDGTRATVVSTLPPDASARTRRASIPATPVPWDASHHARQSIVLLI
jgi:hypothetical protein